MVGRIHNLMRQDFFVTLINYLMESDLFGHSGLAKRQRNRQDSSIELPHRRAVWAVRGGDHLWR